MNNKEIDDYIKNN